MDDIIKQLEACHDIFEECCDIDIINDALDLHRALIDRLKAIPTWHMSVDEMAALTPEGE